MFLFKSMVYSGLNSCQTSRPASREYSLKSIIVYVASATFTFFKSLLGGIKIKGKLSTVLLKLNLWDFQPQEWLT